MPKRNFRISRDNPNTYTKYLNGREMVAKWTKKDFKIPKDPEWYVWEY